MIRIGHGMDVHRLVEGRKLILCGVEIPHTLGHEPFPGIPDYQACGGRT